MISLIADYLVKSIRFFFFDMYFIFQNFDPVEIENENRKTPYQMKQNINPAGMER
jgi:hypothetical protein